MSSSWVTFKVKWDFHIFALKWKIIRFINLLSKIEQIYIKVCKCYSLFDNDKYIMGYKYNYYQTKILQLTNLEELSLRRVLALPKDSRIMLDCNIWYLVWWNSLACPVMAVRYCKDNFIASVLPEPDSPLKRTHWSVFISRKDLQARSVTA